MLSSFNTLFQILIYIFSAFTVIFAVRYFIKWIYHNIYWFYCWWNFCRFTIVLLSYSFALLALVYILCMCEVWLGGIQAFNRNNTKLFSKWLHHSSPQFTTSPLVSTSSPTLEIVSLCIFANLFVYSSNSLVSFISPANKATVCLLFMLLTIRFSFL